MKITNRTTKEDLINYLNSTIKAVKSADKNLYDRIVYTGKSYNKDNASVTKGDLASLAKEVLALLTPQKELQVVVENSVKTLKKIKKSEEVKSESVKEPVKEAPKKEAPKKEAPKTEVKKSETPKKDTKKDTKETPKNTPKKEQKKEETPKRDHSWYLNAQKDFEKTFELDGVTYELAEDIKTMEDLYKAVSDENGAPVVFAFHWNKQQIKAFDYFNHQVPTPKEFPLDLDLATCIYVSDEKIVAYALSMYTEANYCILPDDISDSEDGVRFSSGVDYQIYRQITEQE